MKSIVRAMVIGVLAWGIGSSAWAALQTISGDPLRIELTGASGSMKVFRKFGTNEVYTKEYFGAFYSYLQLVSGTTTNRFNPYFPNRFGYSI